MLDPATPRVGRRPAAAADPIASVARCVRVAPSASVARAIPSVVRALASAIPFAFAFAFTSAACGGGGGAAAPSIAPRGAAVTARAPSASLVARLPSGADANLVVYADVAAFLRTDVGRAFANGGAARAGELGDACIGDVLPSILEVGAVMRGEDFVVVARHDPTATTIAPCVKKVLGLAPAAIDGPDGAFAIRDLVAIFPPGFVVFGAAPLVRQAATARAAGADSPLAKMRLDGEQLAVFDATIDRSGEHPALSLHGALTASAERVGVAVDVDADDAFATQLAAEIESTRGRGRTGDARLDAVLHGITVQRRGGRLSLGYEIRGGTEERALGLAETAVRTIHGIGRYVAEKRQAEVRATLEAIGARYVAWWQRRTDGAPEKRKLVAFPPVPATVPRGVRRSLTDADWKAWEPLGFAIRGAVRYQFEVVVAPDGQSVEAIARGDLDGDGDPSLFAYRLSLDHDGRGALVPNFGVEQEDPDE